MFRKSPISAGKTALVTGAASGIGRELVGLLAAEGMQVAAVDLNEHLLAEVVAENPSGSVTSFVADVTDRERMATVVGSFAATEGRVDLVVANAGIAPPNATIRTVDLVEFDRVVAVNLTGALNTVKPAIEHLINASGHVVIVSSVAAFIPGPGGAAYTASKAAVEQLGRSLRIELAPHRVSCGVSYFGFVQTPMADTHFDQSEVGRRVQAISPQILAKRVSAKQAAESILVGARSRKAVTIAPSRWGVYLSLRGVLQRTVDFTLAHDPRWRGVVKMLERS